MISCQTHDYIEIACLYGFAIRLTLASNDTLEGKAVTTETTADKREWLIIEREQGLSKIEMQQIRSMQALQANAHFDLVTF